MKHLIHLFTAGLIALVATSASAETPAPQCNLDHGVALQGYDPVSYFQGAPVKGDPARAVTRGGVTYQFATDANRKTFEADPAKYEPAYGGWCAWAMAQKGEKVEVDPVSFKIVDGRLFLFYNGFLADTRKDWDKLSAKEGETSLVQRADTAWKRLLGAP